MKKSLCLQPLLLLIAAALPLAAAEPHATNAPAGTNALAAIPDKSIIAGQTCRS